MRTISTLTSAARAMDQGEMLGSTMQFWKGRMYAPIPGDSEATLRYKSERRAAFVRDLQQAFVPAENMIHGVVGNAADHVLGSEPTWNLTAQDTKALEAILTPTWNDRDLHGLCQRVIRSRIRDGEGAARLRIPAGAVLAALKGDGTPIKAATQWLRFEALDEPERLTIIEDEATLTLKSTLDLGKTKDGEERGIEEAFVDEKGDTVLQLRKGGAVTVLWRLPLGGRLPYVQIQGGALVTQGMVDNQAGANMVMTASINNSELAGQIMEHFHNMQPQRGPDKTVTVDGVQTQVQGDPLPALRGPGGELYTNDTVATQTVDDDKGVRDVPVILKGSYTRHGPVDSSPLDFTLSRCEYNIYAEAKQRHYLMADKASATGEARKTAMASFFKSLNGYRRDAVKLLRGLLELTLAMSFALCKQTAPEVEVEPVLTDRLVDPNPEDRAADREDVKAGIISKQDARARQGLTNTEAVQQQIDKEVVKPPDPEPAPNPSPTPDPAGGTT
ncbi:hypothetical protein [Deinococcus sp. QL22]|uniref:hypothetical protein n=1 Tax=Deinococcus sp. QL22 TaxID=2939437 RepID=UPI002016CB20|nr:hypothetical protein [Deinococcus sp. QL22]UQN06772.1 hypothetical protein M1R55_02290 [Deinococcus sp. QL22]